MTNKTQLISLAIFFLVLAGCQSTRKIHTAVNKTPEPINPEATNPEITSSETKRLENQKQLQQLDRWKISAKVSVDRRGQHYSTAYLNWLEKSNEYQIDLTSPMGIGQLNIIYNGQNVIATVTQPNGQSKRYNVKNIDDFINKLSGLALPVSQLQYWIKGVPDPHHNHSEAQYDANHNLTGLKQQDWKIEWDRFKPQEGLQLPHKIKATQQRGGALKVTLIIANWELGNNF